MVSFEFGFASTRSERWFARATLVCFTLLILCLDDDVTPNFFIPLRRTLQEGSASKDTIRIHRRLRQLAKKHITPRNIPPLVDDTQTPPPPPSTQTQTSASESAGPKRAFQPAEKYLGKVFPKTEQMPFYVRNTLEPFPEGRDVRDIIFFWHIPKTGGELVKNIFGRCFGLRWAQKLKEPASLEMVHDYIINVDTSTPEGIAEAHKLGLVDSNKVDFISSRYALSASSLFTPQHRGRAFTILRHPIDLAASNFFARKALHPELRSLTLVQYVNKNYYADNWITRQLTGTLPHEELTDAHLESAKHILSTKYFVGIYEQLDETLRQLKAFYKLTPLQDQEYCARELVNGDNPKFIKTERPKPARGSSDWRTVASVEKWDLELYYLALEMFSQQGSIFIAQEYSLV
ncbi:hypothetical protein ACHAW6_005256 [Cyclotella cf. meneghiniana]